MATENDVVLIYFENKPLTFARIEEILSDNKVGWYHVKLLILQVPLQTTVWILRDSYIDGAEFTMGGQKVRMELVVCPEDPKETDNLEEKGKTSGAEVISLTDRRKKITGGIFD